MEELNNSGFASESAELTKLFGMYKLHSKSTSKPVCEAKPKPAQIKLGISANQPMRYVRQNKMQKT